MNPNWTRNGWCHKVIALGIITSYFLLLIFIHDTIYIWATLALIFVLFVTTFSCASHESTFLTQLRNQRAVGIITRPQEHFDINQEQIQGEARIWMTDIPPSYSFVMSNLPPQTPPPSYGSAILMFPPPYVAIETKNNQNTIDRPTCSEGRQFRSPLSFSTQMSVSGGMSETLQGGAISFSTQVSVISSNHSEIPQDLAVRARFYISREDSIEDGNEENNTSLSEGVIQEAQKRLLLLSRQFSREGSAEGEGQDSNKLDRRYVAFVSRQLSRDDGYEEINLQRQILKQDLRRRIVLSTQVSREDVLHNYEKDLSHNETTSSKIFNEEAKESSSDDRAGISGHNSQNETNCNTQEPGEIFDKKDAD